MASQAPIRALSLDGGGIRGLSSIMLLKGIMSEINRPRIANGEEPLQPWQVFDIMGGTSTGGIIAIMLGRFHYTVEECETVYLELSENAFQPRNPKSRSPFEKIRNFLNAEAKLDTKALEAVLRKEIARRYNDTEVPLYEANTKCKVFVTVTQGTDSDTALWRSYDNPEAPASDETWKAWEACRATSAAPTFFNPLEAGKYRQQWVDGGLGCNNPVMEVYREAQEIWKDHDVVLVSLGTGEAPGPSSIGNLKKIIEALRDLVTETDKTADNFFKNHKELSEKGLYFRFSVTNGLANIPLDEYNKIKDIADATQKYLRSGKVFKEFQRCGETLRANSLDGLLNRAEPFSIPFNPDEKFKELPGLVPRPELLESIEQKLSDEQNSKKVLTLYGLAGIGKTQLAASFIRRNEAQYTAIFAINGGSEGEFRLGLASLASKIPELSDRSLSRNAEGIRREEVALPNPKIEEETITYVLNWLNRRGNTKWLLLIDGVASQRTLRPGDFFITHYLDRLNQGTIILTTQHSDISQIHLALEVPEFNTAQSMELVKKRIAPSRNISDADLGELIVHLSAHPLAIDNAACYIGINIWVDPKQYIELWDSANLELLKNEPSYRANDSIYRTIEVSIKALDQETTQFLQLCAFLDESDIWFDLFSLAQPHHPQWIRDLASNIAVFEGIIQTLGNLSLIHPSTTRHKDPKMQSYIIHSAVHKCARHIADSGEWEEDTINLAIDIVGSVVPRCQDIDYGNHLQRLAPHAAKCKLHLDWLATHHKLPRDMTLVNISKLGSLYRDQGLLKDAEGLYAKARDGYTKMAQQGHSVLSHELLPFVTQTHQGPTTPSNAYENERLIVLNSLGLVYMDEGKSLEAIEMFCEAIEGRTKILHPTNPLIFSSQYNLALAYSQMKQWKAAEPLFKAAAAGFTQLGSAHPDMVKRFKVMGRLGYLYIQLRRLDEAESILTKAWAGFKHNLEENHPWALLIARDQGLLYRQQKKWQDSEDKLKFALDGYTALWGSDSRMTLEILGYLANLYRHMLRYESIGDRDMTCKTFQELISRQKRVLGKNHYNTLKSIHCYGLLYVDINKNKAEQLFEEVLAGYDALTNQNTYDRICTVVELAEIYQSKDRFKESICFFDEAIAWYALDRDSYSTRMLNSMFCRAMALTEWENWEEAEAALIELLSVNGSILSGGLKESTLKIAKRRLEKVQQRLRECRSNITS